MSEEDIAAEHCLGFEKVEFFWLLLAKKHCSRLVRVRLKTTYDRP